MPDPLRFAYTPARSSGYVALRPLLSVTLTYGKQARSVTGLLDTGADINVLPYTLGQTLGVSWEEQTSVVTGLSGKLANYDARGLVLQATVENLRPVRLVFAWTHAENVPLIFGQVNFFAEFNVCFYRSENAFDITLKTAR